MQSALFPSAELRARADLTLAAVLRALLVALPVLLVASLIRGLQPPVLYLFALMLCYTAGLLFLQRRVGFDHCVHAVVYGLIAFSVAIAALQGSVRSVGTIGVIVAITIGGVFLRPRSLIIAVGTSVLSVGALISAENAAWLRAPNHAVNTWHWVTYSVIIAAVAMVLSYIRSLLHDVLLRHAEELEQRRRAEAAREASDTRFKKVFDSSPVGMTVTRVSDGRYLEANRADRHNLGYAREELVGRTTLEMGAWFSSEDRQRFIELLRERRGVEGYETRMRHRSGEIVDCRVWASLEEIDGEECVVSSTINITNQLRAERELQENLRELNAVLEQRVCDRTQELETANRDLEGFSYSVSHDLRAPLRAIIGFSARLREKEAGHLSESGSDLLRRVEQGARRAAALIDALLEFSRLGRKPVTKVQVSMPAIVLDVLRELSAQPEAQRVEVRLGALPDCRGDPILLKQVWQNLIGNAFKYSRKCDRPVVEIGHEHAEYFVRDNGAGFDMEYASKLFGVFERLHSAAEFEGTGIGLANANRIVQRHGGAIRGEGAPDRGATFRFRLPEAS